MPNVPEDFEATKTYGIEELDTLAEIVQAGDFWKIETAVVKADTGIAPKRWSHDLLEEWTMLLRQFESGTAIAFAVPLLTPLLRRKIDFDTNFAKFHTLWRDYEDRLLTELSTRWLVSCCDTFIKNPRSPEEEAWGFAGAFFMKTIKLYETEELRLKDFPDLDGPIQRIDVETMEQVYGRPMLFDGIQPFNLSGYGDMIEKMGHRLNASGSSQISYKIMRELFDRAHRNETVFRRIDDHVQQFKN